MVGSFMLAICRLSSVGRASHSYRSASVYASLWGNLEVKRSLKRGNLNSSAVGNPVLIPVGMSVETLYDPPTAIVAIGEEKVQTTNITISDGNENCSWYECGGRVFKSHRRHHTPREGVLVDGEALCLVNCKLKRTRLD